MKNQMVNREAMISRNNPRQGRLLDPWEHLGLKRRHLLENSWAGLFRQEILAELPVNQIAPWFRADFGRPSKELYTVLGVLAHSQMSYVTKFMKPVHKEEAQPGMRPHAFPPLFAFSPFPLFPPS